jgi:ABC-type nickel/cobalt efflux system permease component RcnA
MAKMTLALEGSKSVGGLLLVIALSLAYGIFHAAGPGHGKTVVSSFLLANESKIIHSFIIGYLVAAVHALSALTVVGVLYYLIRGIFATGVERTNRYIQLVTFAVIAAIGAVMLVRRVAGREHHHHGPSAESLPARRLTTRSLLGIAVPAGIIPCPGAVAVILFALSLHMLAVSILAICSISLGMGTTIGLTGAAVVLVKRGAIRVFAGAQKERDSKIRTIVEVSGAAVLFLFGLILFLAQL